MKRLRTRQKSIQRGDGNFSFFITSFETHSASHFWEEYPIQYMHTGIQVLQKVDRFCLFVLRNSHEQKKTIPRLQDEDFSHHITYPPGCQDPRRTTLMFSLHCILQPLF